MLLVERVASDADKLAEYFATYERKKIEADELNG
jgi:hypothetical protein